MHRKPAPFAISETATQSTNRSRKSIGAPDVLASIVVLFTLAIAQPLLDLLGRNAEFFVARDSSNPEVVVYAFTLALIIPAVLGAITLVAGRINPVAGNVIHALIFISLGATLSLLVFQRTPLEELTGWVQAAIAVAASTSLLALYRRSEALRRFTRWGMALPPIALGLFLFSSTVSDLFAESAAAAAVAADEVGEPAPVVFLIFDALPVSSLMDMDGELQEDLYPNFARLAEDATWYRNAISLNYLTELSVPAIVSGMKTMEGELPIVQDHPENLFTLLENHYDIRAYEPITRLCPESTCRRNEAEATSLLERWRGLISDTSVVTGHLVLPADLATGLPPIDETWGDFTGATGSSNDQTEPDSSDFSLREEFHAVVGEQDRRDQVSGFIETMEVDRGRPTLDFLHALIPHSPWNYLPSGQLHDVPEGRLPSRRQENGSWVDDPWRIDQVYQLHLLQVQYVDTVLGMVLDQLHKLGSYDESLIVVVSDHGDSYRAGMPRQRDKPEIVSDVLPIPLFIKAPNQTKGEIDDYRAHTVDVVPTVADLLEIDLPWTSDGVSLVAPDRPTRGGSEVETISGVTEYHPSLAPAFSRAEEKIERLGTEGPFGLAPPGQADLLGRPLDSLSLGDPAPGEVILRAPGRLRDVDPNADVLPISIRGRLNGADGQEIVIALSLNGEIVSVTRSYVNGNGVTVFDALLPPDALQAGQNDLQLIEVSGTGFSRSFRPLD